jgi:selenocysteine-specific translation elongation factor
VFSKCDLSTGAHKTTMNMIKEKMSKNDERRHITEVIEVSAKTGKGIDDLKRALTTLMP